MSAKPSAKPSASISIWLEIISAVSFRPMVKVDCSKAQNALRQLQVELGPVKFQQAAARALNHTMGITKTAVNGAIREVFKIPTADINDRLFPERASPTKLQASLWASIAPLPMGIFKPVQISDGQKIKFVGSKKKGSYTMKPTRQTGMGVAIEILRGKSKMLRTAFIAIKGGNVGITAPVRAFGSYGNSGFDFSNEQSGRTSTLKTVSVYWAIQREQVGEKATNEIAPVYAERFEHELERITSRLK